MVNPRLSVIQPLAPSFGSQASLHSLSTRHLDSTIPVTLKPQEECHVVHQALDLES